MSDCQRQHLVDKQRGLCASCRVRLPADIRVRRDVYPDEISISCAQCPECYHERRPRSDGYKRGMPHDEFFAKFKRP